jgi:hypothetical protein
MDITATAYVFTAYEINLWLYIEKDKDIKDLPNVFLVVKQNVIKKIVYIILYA